MTELQASRTLVKSPPELWAECSDAASLARHLDGFGEIRITRLEPETAVAWEGERARGTVRIEPAGWGTKVILTAVAEGEEVVVDAPPEPESPVEAASPEPESPVEAPAPEPEPPMVHALAEPSDEALAPAARKRRFARLRAFWRGEPLAAPEVVPVQEPPVTIAVDAPAEPQAPPPAREEPPTAPEAPGPAVPGTEAALTAALDSLGQAHHRPYSRA
jgi:hypothetical protein